MCRYCWGQKQIKYYFMPGLSNIKILNRNSNRSYELICMMHRIWFLLVMDLNIFSVTKRYLQMESGILNSWVKFCCMLTQCSYCYFDSWGLKKRMKTYLHQTNESWQKERWRDKDIKYQKWFHSKKNCFTGSSKSPIKYLKQINVGQVNVYPPIHNL